MPQRVTTEKTREGAPYLTVTDAVDTRRIDAVESRLQRFDRDPILSSNAIVDRAGVIYPIDTSGNTVTVTLASSLVADGTQVIVNDEGGNAATNAITIDTEGSETIDGATSFSITGNHGEVSLYSDGTNWYTFG